MFDGITPHSPEDRLPLDAYDHVARMLRLTLPPPPEPSAEALRRRDHAAIAQVAALAPADAAEASLAAQFVAASAQWADCLRLAQAPETTREWAAKCRAQAAAMMRQASAALRLLQRAQAAREKRGNAEADRRARAEHITARLMATALAAIPDAKSEGEPTAAPAAPDRAEAHAAPAPARDEARGEHRPTRGVAPELVAPELVAAAERYAALWPDRAAQIRRTRKLPSDVRHFDPPEAAVAHALIHAQTPTLTALDPAPAEPGPA